MNKYVKVMKLENLNTLVIKDEGNKFFTVTAPNNLIISIPHLSYLLKYLLLTDVISPKLIEGVLGEYYNAKEE